MSEINEEELRKNIEEILKTADLKTTSVKKVRLQLEKTMGLDLKPHVAKIEKIVMEIVDREESDDEEKPSEEEEEEEEEKPAPKTRKRKTDDDDDGKAKKKKKAPSKKAGGAGRGAGGGYTRPYRLSPALSQLMGAEEMPRHEVVKRVWAIIKEKQLYDPNNRQFAICDDALYQVIGTKRFRTFGMMKYLKNHFLD